MRTINNKKINMKYDFDHFTLVEVLVSIFLVTFAVVGLYSVLSKSRETAHYARIISEADQLCYSVGRKIIAMEYDDFIDTDDDDFTYSPESLSYSHPDSGGAKRVYDYSANLANYGAVCSVQRALMEDSEGKEYFDIGIEVTFNYKKHGLVSRKMIMKKIPVRKH